MRSKKIFLIAFYIYLLNSIEAQAETQVEAQAETQAVECFKIALPLGVNEFRLPTELRFIQTLRGDLGTSPGFKIYHTGRNLSLSGPACFLLRQNIFRNIDVLAKFLGEAGGSGPIIELFGSDITLDLGNKIISSNQSSTVIYEQVWGILQRHKKKNYAFKNGSIETQGNGIIMNGWQYGGQTPKFKPSQSQIDMATSWYGPNFRDFEDTNIILENLNIKSGGLAAYLVGRNNIIRHCHIEVEGHEAIALFGADNQLIDNEIIVKRSKSTPPKPYQPPTHLDIGSYYEEYAAIWIRDAPGLIIRGNKITIEGLIPAKEAILLINSPNVTIENNEVSGSENLYTVLDKQSSARAYNNHKKSGKWPNTQ